MVMSSRFSRSWSSSERPSGLLDPSGLDAVLRLPALALGPPPDLNDVSSWKLDILEYSLCIILLFAKN